MPFPAGSILFVADVHLTPSAPGRTAAFLDFLAGLARLPLPGALYVLGDLFDVWLGRASLLDEGHAPVMEALRALSDSGVAVTVVRGNRDFLLDGAFGERAGAAVVEEGISLALGSSRAYLCHGDRLLHLDRPHQRMRWVLRSAAGRALAAALPASAVRGAARWLRRRSEEAGARRRPGFSSVPADAAARIFRGGYDLIIAGHIHQERRSRLEIDGRTCELYTLGAWEERGSVLVFDGGPLRFESCPAGRPSCGPGSS